MNCACNRYVTCKQCRDDYKQSVMVRKISMIDVKQYLKDNYPDEVIITIDGFDEAFIGIGYSFNKPYACYDREKMIQCLKADIMTYDEAEEYLDFNVLGAYIGENNPVIIDVVER